ncbi:hypothetical protein [Salinibacter grassmerensis]|uniref:hypothetical protein n=1 Tax=Salinibacter grassmerensis TaxID=3040353 RepID=UPI0021E8551B|nr:hypothetical protein [Salinibacter grassmerensis]
MRHPTTAAILCVLLFALPARAQVDSSPVRLSNAGLSVQAVFMERAPVATGIAGHASWALTQVWELQVGVRRDAVMQRDIRRAYGSRTEWADQRRFSFTPALAWRPFRSDGALHQSFRVSVGPTLQVQRGEQVRRLGAVDRGTSLERLTTDAGLEGDNIYLDRSRTTPLLLLTDNTNRTNVGVTAELRYGLTYEAVTVEALLTGRRVTGVDGVTVGFGGRMSVAL